MALEIDFDFCHEETLRCKGKKDTDRANQEGEYFGNIFIGNRKWAIVLWDNVEDPDLYKAECLLIEQKSWVSI